MSFFAILSVRQDGIKSSPAAKVELPSTEKKMKGNRNWINDASRYTAPKTIISTYIHISEKAEEKRIFVFFIERYVYHENYNCYEQVFEQELLLTCKITINFY